MRRVYFGLVSVILMVGGQLLAQNLTEKHTGRPVSTYSIVALDTVNNEMGVAVQSHWFSVGPVVPFARAGVGVVATQSLVDISYGPLGLDLMQGGKTANQALEALTTADPHSDVRQVAMIDVEGSIATHTGEHCIPDAGHVQGKTYSVQANMMLNETVWPAMSKAFEGTEGDLATRMLASLKAAQEAGGDIRGKQSAAILIVSTESTGRPWADTKMELRIEDHPKPVQELERLVRLHRAYVHMNKGDLALERHDVEEALKQYSKAEAMAPENLEMKFWHAVSLVNNDRVDESIPLFKEIFAKDANWAELLKRLKPVGQLDADQETIDRILEEAQ